MPISFLITVPQISKPSERTKPAFNSPMVTVLSARTHTPSAVPLSPDMPLGISAEMTYAPLLFMASITSAYSPVTSRERPVPKMQSTITSPSIVWAYLPVYLSFSRSQSGEGRPPQAYTFT